MISLLVPLVLVALVILAVRRARAGQGATEVDAHVVRRLFQYAVLLGLLVVVAVGLSGLLGRLLDQDVLVAGDEALLARDLSFLVVGGPLLAGIVVWSRRRLAGDSSEVRSLVWALYVAVAALTSLLVAATALQQVLGWVVGLDEWRGSALAQALVWGGVWGLHWWLDARITPDEHRPLHLLVGSLVGLVLAGTGLAGLLLGSLRQVVGLESGDVLASGDNPLLRGLVTLAVGAPIWLVYWLRTTSRRSGDTLWLTYVLLAGVAGGLVTAVVAASSLIVSILVWVVGDPGAARAVEHFDGAPTATAGAVVGALVWWYHQAVLRERGVTGRSEVRRVYEYLVAAIGLVAAAVGLVLVVAALIEAVTGGVLAADAPLNTLLAALTAIGVGGTVWWLHWRLIRSAAEREPAAEIASVVRRLYLVVLFGVGGVSAVIALIVAVFLLFQDAVEGALGLETLRRTRLAIGVLLTTAAVAGYHLTVYLGDRSRSSAVEPAVPGPTFVLLVGPEAPDIAAAVAHRTHARVQSWTRIDDGATPWSAEAVLAALATTTATDVVVLAEPDGVRVIPVRRR